MAAYSMEQTPGPKAARQSPAIISLRRLVFLFGLVCCCIGLAHVALGSKAIYGSVPVNPTMDSEDRFFGTLFVGFGAALAWSSRDLVARAGVFKSLLFVFFLGGVARLISVAMVGLPNGLFIFLGVVELVLPPALWAWHRSIEQRAAIRRVPPGEGTGRT